MEFIMKDLLAKVKSKDEKLLKQRTPFCRIYCELEPASDDEIHFNTYVNGDFDSIDNGLIQILSHVADMQNMSIYTLCAKLTGMYMDYENENENEEK